LAINLRRRLVKILTFPIIVSIFLIGWILYCVGNKQENRPKGNSKKSTAVRKQEELTADEGIEMGLIEEKIIT